MLRPKSSAVEKSDAWWVVPVRVLRRTSASSYVVQIKPGVQRDVHMDQRKPFVGGEGIDLHYIRAGYRVTGVTPGE